ncbi:MAG: hypothetical protein K9J37_17950 [Saprospiraceae bacterium]|nr:hypothetical protein [Saprospiraceae bacterium]MCF8251802.1 hypothetical protein [Saprospiraceae bacterium]MCF8281456.1 hypothetical protein [Bacteroidales bacterium]MCF8313516.1 hypothetical protein [Saprospiraceae bacterium]MCF8442261.1 hypothetical protein [Saprospiraceae bacterium]
MDKENYFYRGDLPHWQPPEGTFFITYRLFGSVPIIIIEELKKAHQVALLQIEREPFEKEGVELADLPPNIRNKWLAIMDKKRYEEGARHFKRLDDFLDTNLNEPHWLKQPDIARLVADAIHHGADKYYKLWAFCIMSNHVHILLTMLPGAPILWKVLQDSKKYTGRKANRLLGREGQFWETESFDHLVREKRTYQKGSFGRIFWYILNNPVKARLAVDWKDWPWSYAHPDFVPPNSSSAV